jgi:excisionase family DNA binding protein
MLGMRYKIVVRRVQIAERHIRAADEDAAAEKIQSELDRPYGFLGSWQTIDTDLDIIEAESPLSGPPPQLSDSNGSMLLSVKTAAAHLGVPTGTMYQLINSGEIAHVVIGSRRYVSRDQLAAFVDSHSHVS